MPHKKRGVTQRDSFCELGPLKACGNYLQILFCWNGPQARKKNGSIFIEKKTPANNFLSEKTNEVSGSKSRPLYRMTPLYLTVSKKYEKEKNFFIFFAARRQFNDDFSACKFNLQAFSFHFGDT